ncbi:MAG: thiamine pyrophosphate-dependent dehydrogenase E1 component subunit alpha [Acidocella sp.]|nr:thiamine pyrophosphate-dependent dehydrogenase E1 component subunit alpha [Acidocella sp.]
MTRQEMLYNMKLIRAFEDALAARRDHGFQLLSSGEEAVAVGVCAALEPQDQLLTGGRSIGFALARGLDPARVMGELLGKATGTNKGKGGRGHLSAPAQGFFGAHAVVAGNISIAAGVALARQMTGEPGIVVVVFGDGASGAGILHETLNIAALWRLPILFVCNNNQLSVSTSRQAALALKAISDVALAYGMKAKTLDGMDVDIVAEAVAQAIGAIRSGSGPAFLEFTSCRFAAHSTTARETRSREELQVLRTHCPIAALTEALLQTGQLGAEALTRMEAEISDKIAGTLRFADASPYPVETEALCDVF